MCNKTSILSFLLREGVQRTTGVRNTRFLILHQLYLLQDASRYLKHSPFLFSGCATAILFHGSGHLPNSTLLFFSDHKSMMRTIEGQILLKIALIRVCLPKVCQVSFKQRPPSSVFQIRKTGCSLSPWRAAAEEDGLTVCPRCPAPALGLLGLLGTVRGAAGVQMQGKWKLRGERCHSERWQHGMAFNSCSINTVFQVAHLNSSRSGFLSVNGNCYNQGGKMWAD